MRLLQGSAKNPTATIQVIRLLNDEFILLEKCPDRVLKPHLYSYDVYAKHMTCFSLRGRNMGTLP